MRKHRIVVGMLAVLLLAAPSARSEERVGMVTGIRGGVVLERAGEEESARMMGLLQPGDRLAVAEAGEATVILFAEGRRLRLPAGAEVRLTAVGWEAVSGPAVESLAPLPGDALKILRDQLLAGEPGRGAGVVFRTVPRVEPELTLLAPVESCVATRNPRFWWRSLPGAERYRLTVSNLEGDELWQETTTGTELAYPAEATPLDPGGAYFWDLRAFAPEGRSAVAGSDFTLLDEEAMESLAARRAALEALVGADGGDPGPLIVLAALYRDLELFGDAESVLRELTARYPEEALVSAALEDLYREWGRRPPEAAAPSSP